MKKTYTALLCVLLILCAASCGTEQKTPPATITPIMTTEPLPFTERPSIVNTEPASTVNIKTKESDPYSYVAKAYYLLEHNYEYYAKADNDMILFKKELAHDFKMLPDTSFYGLDSGEFSYSYGYKPLYYSLYDIDGSGVKEFLLGRDDKLLDIYTVRNGTAVQIENFINTPSSLFINRTLMTSHWQESEWRADYFRLSDGRLVYKMTLIEDAMHNYYYYSNAEGTEGEINKEEYERLKKEQEGDGQKIELNWKPLAEYGR